MNWGGDLGWGRGEVYAKGRNWGISYYFVMIGSLMFNFCLGIFFW